MPKRALPVNLTEGERQQLERWVAAHGTPQQVALRCRIVLSAAAGHNNVAIGGDLGVDVKTVALWRTRFTQGGPEAMWEIAPGRGRKPTHGPQKIRPLWRPPCTPSLRG